MTCPVLDLLGVSGNKGREPASGSGACLSTRELGHGDRNLGQKAASVILSERGFLGILSFLEARIAWWGGGKMGKEGRSSGGRVLAGNQDVWAEVQVQLYQ